MAAGPLQGIRVIELAGIGPGPFAGMMLADLGAEVIRVARPGATAMVGHRIMERSRTHVAIDLKDPEGAALLLDLTREVDGVIEGFRPGVLERLGLGPDELLAANPALVIGRMTGWGQDGPWSQMAGHDLNYIAVTGALAAIGRRGQGPSVPLNLVGDFGGGAMFLVVGMLAGLLHARATGQGQVVDAAMVDGTSALMAMFHDIHNAGLQRLERGSNLLDSGAWFYDVYECADGEWISLGPIEPQFRAELCDLLDLGEEFRAGDDPVDWPALSARLGEVIASRPRTHWDELLTGTDACYAPVIDLDEARRHPHLQARGTFTEVDGSVQPSPAPRFSATPSGPPRGRRPDAADTRSVLAVLGLEDDRITDLAATGIVEVEDIGD